MIPLIKGVGGMVHGGEGEEEIDVFVCVNPLFALCPCLCHPLETGSGLMPLGDVNSAWVMSPPSMPGDINFISQKMQQPVASGQTVTLEINIGRAEIFNGKAL